MQDVRTANDLAKESGLSLPTVVKLLEGVKPEVVIGRVKGYHPDALRAALINKHSGLLEYLGALDAACSSLTGYGSE